MSKWEKFHSSYSPIKAGDINQGSHRLDQDWTRLIMSDQATLNGRNLQDYAQYNNYMEKIESGERITYKFKNDDAVKAFFSQVLLKNIASDQKNEALNFLEKSFHQGGLMYPVSASATELLKNKKGQAILLASSEDISKKINFQLTDTGFKIQEIYTVGSGLVPPSDPEDPIPKALLDGITELDPRIKPDAGNDYLFKAEATLDVDFSKNSSNPKISIKSNKISYGNEAVKSVVDKRSFLQIMIDKIKSFIGKNVVIDLSSQEEKKPDKVSEEKKGFISPKL